MSTFECNVVKVKVEPHDNADSLEIACIGGYRAIVRKGQFSDGDAAVYIPEDSVLPEWLLDRMGLTGKLAGSKANRVKAVRLRGVLSQGLLYNVENLDGESFGLPVVEFTPDGLPTEVVYPVTLGMNVADILGVTKYRPELPKHMGGDLINIRDYGIDFDVENIKKYPDVLVKGEDVRITEKIHGTFVGVGIVPEKDANPEFLFNRIVVFSKGVGEKGLGFKANERNAQNLYLTAAKKFGVAQYLMDNFREEDEAVYIFGEIFGNKVQDLKYGIPSGVSFRVFDGARGNRYNLEFSREIYAPAIASGIFKEVPVLYEGPYSPEIVETYTNGKESVSGNSVHIREGVVIRTVPERREPEILRPLGGRVILKSVSSAYILRKSGTEYQ